MFDLETAGVVDPDDPRIATTELIEDCTDCIFVFQPIRCYACSKQNDEEE